MSLGCPRCGSLITGKHVEGCNFLVSMDERDIPNPRLSRNTSSDPTGQKLLKKINSIPPMPDEDTGKPTWRVKTCVKSVREEFLRYYDKDGEDKARPPISLGWFAHFDGSRESMFLGFDEPDLNGGDEVEIVIRKR